MSFYTERAKLFLFFLSLLPFLLPLFHCQGLLLVQPLPSLAEAPDFLTQKSRFRHKIPQYLRRKSHLNKILFSNLANFTPLTTIAATARRHFVPINFSSSPDVLFFLFWWGKSCVWSLLFNFLLPMQRSSFLSFLDRRRKER